MHVDEYVGFAVRPDSALQSARDVVERLRKDPASLSIAVSAPRQLGGVYAEAPTWSAVIGKPAAYANWRGVVGPRDMTAAQIAFWDELLGRLAQIEEWQADLKKRFQDPDYRNSAETRQFLERETAELRSILAELGLVKSWEFVGLCFVTGC